MGCFRRARSAGLAGLALAGALLAAGAPGAIASPAHAASEAGRIAQSCGEQPVCLVDGASVENAAELGSALPEGVRVVVIPQPDQAQSVPSSTIAAELRSATGAETVIVIEDRATDRFAVSSAGDAAAITEALYSQGASDGGTAVAAIRDELVPAAGADAPDAAIGAGAGIIAGAALAVAAVAAGAVWLILRRRRRRERTAFAISAKLEKELAAALDGEDGAYVSEAVDALEELTGAYPDLGERIAALAQHVSELFVRVRRRGTDQQIRLLQSQYKDTLSKLLKALHEDYYGDILRNPQYWSNPEARLAEVRRAVESVDQQAVENIRQVNESRDLEFKVALDSLIKTVAEAKLSDVYPDRES
ncbi:hypothetical protein MUN77_13710 [Leucobacter allii]|uniref:hypothetical protein n=1 Tax=Leucobacter allii TaxID=2932247 RepID=UPI001FD5717E|nr:hypothetical protein [Leucobacter allii]UOR01177.1 hypothetical protein MUN77_13710 [Leucobacter allii]